VSFLELRLEVEEPLVSRSHAGLDFTDARAACPRMPSRWSVWVARAYNKFQLPDGLFGCEPWSGLRTSWRFYDSNLLRRLGPMAAGASPEQEPQQMPLTKAKLVAATK
jgi:hypothetical protein